MLDTADYRSEEASASPEAIPPGADLVHVSDEEPGIRRRKAGKGFYYIGPGGERITEPATLDRIRHLAIPPAYTDVWIAPTENAYLQATGRDARGRKQYRYHPRWTELRDEVKYGGLIEFAHALPAARARIRQDLAHRGLPREKVLASIVWLLENALIRVGNMSYAKENESFGLTTLRDQHVAIEGSHITFQFKGKSNKIWNLGLTDRRIARIVRSCQDLPGQHLFQYVDADSQQHAVKSEDVNAYIRQITESTFSAKNFRTWAGTVRAAALLAALPPPATKSEATRGLNGAIDEVASRLGNTRAVCRKSYVHPQVIDGYLAGRLADELQAVDVSAHLDRGLDEAEARVLAWLERNAEPA